MEGTFMNKPSIFKILFAAFLLVTNLFSMNTVLFAQSSPRINLEVYSLQEESHDSCVAKTRIYVKNTGTVTIDDFVLYYYFTDEEGNIPVLEEYSIPDPKPKINLVNNGGGEYAIRMEFSGVNLKPGDILPNKRGYSLGYHNYDWSEIDEADDFSNTGTKSYTLNDKVSVIGIVPSTKEEVACDGRTSNRDQKKRDYKVSYKIRRDWGTGATIDVTITNNSSKPLKDWKLDWAYTGPQQVSGLWNGCYKQNGNKVSVSNQSYNSAIPANGGSVDFGLNISYCFANEIPLDFILNTNN